MNTAKTKTWVARRCSNGWEVVSERGVIVSTGKTERNAVVAAMRVAVTTENCSVRVVRSRQKN